MNHGVDLDRVLALGWPSSTITLHSSSTRPKALTLRTSTATATSSTGITVASTGHTAEPVVWAVAERMAMGIQFHLPTEDAVIASEELTPRWRLPKWHCQRDEARSTFAAPARGAIEGASGA